MPPTIGRAIQNLSTEWTRYVGEVDKATGTSATAARAINVLAQNLDTLGSLLLSAGKTATAYQALRLAQTFIGIGAAARTATADVAALNAAQTAAAASSATAAAGAGRLASILGGIKTFALVAVLANLKEIGTEIGEGVARWAGYGKSIDAVEAALKAEEEATTRNVASKAALAQKLQLASDKAMGLNDVSRAMVAEFDGVIAKGGGVGDALDKVAKSLDLKDLSGIANAGAALDALSVKGKIGASEIQLAYSAALKGIDLAKFATEAGAMFDASEQGARRLNAALDAVSQESLRRAGTSLEELKTGFSATSASAINDVDELIKTIDKLGLKGTDAGRALAISLEKATDTANTERALRGVIERIEELGQRGLLSGDQVAAGLQKAKEKIDQMLPGVNTLAEAFRLFGLKTGGELTRTADTYAAAWEKIRNAPGVTLGDQVKAFEQYKAAAISAAAATGKVVDGQIRVQEEILRMRQAAELAGRAVGDSMDAASKRVDNFAGRVKSAATDLAELQGLQLTSDGFAANADGSAKGSFNNGVPTDKAFSTKERIQRGDQFGAGDLEFVQAALAQAINAKTYIDATRENSPGAVSFEAQQGADSMLNAARAAMEQVQASIASQGRATTAPGAGQATQFAGRSSNGVRTLVLNLNGKKTSVNLETADDADNLTGFFRSLESAAGASA